MPDLAARRYQQPPPQGEGAGGPGGDGGDPNGTEGDRAAQKRQRVERELDERVVKAAEGWDVEREVLEDASARVEQYEKRYEANEDTVSIFLSSAASLYLTQSTTLKLEAMSKQLANLSIMVQKQQQTVVANDLDEQGKKAVRRLVVLCFLSGACPAYAAGQEWILDMVERLLCAEKGESLTPGGEAFLKPARFKKIIISGCARPKLHELRSQVPAALYNSLNLHGNTSQMDIFGLCSALTKSYGPIEITKTLIERVALLRMYARESPARLPQDPTKAHDTIKPKEMKNNPKFWSEVDESIAAMRDRAKKDPRGEKIAVQSELLSVLKDDFEHSTVRASRAVRAREGERGTVRLKRL